MFQNIRRSIAVFYLLFIVSLNTSGQSWSWAKSEGGIGSEVSEAVTTDASGNIYVTGNFISDSINFGGFILVNAGNSDFYLAKYDPLGNILWAKSSGSSLDEKGMALAADNSGSVIVSGYFESDTLLFGNDTLFNTGSNSKEIFMLKYDSSGNLIWAKSAGGNSNDIVYSIVLDTSGNFYAAGSYVSTTLVFDSISLTNVGDYDAFVAKFDSSGSIIWGRNTGETGADYGYSASVDAAGNVFLSGYYFSSSLTFDTTAISNAGSSDMFLAKYDSNGNVLWAIGAGGAGQEISYSAASDELGNIYISGHYSSANLILGSTTLNNVGTSYNIFLAKVDQSGNFVWAKSAGQNGIDYALSVACRSDFVCITGYFYSPSITFGNITLNNSGNADMYVCKYDTAGNVIWAKSASGPNADYSTETAIDLSGNVVVCGYYGGSISFDLNNLTSLGGIDIFLAKIDDLNNSVIAFDQSGVEVKIIPNPFHGNAKIVLPDNIFNATLSVYDLTGRLVNEIPVDQNSNIVLDNLTQGLYMFKVFIAENIIGSGKFVIEQ